MKLNIQTDNFALDSELEKYASNKLAELSKKLPKNLRRDASLTIQFKQGASKKLPYATCSLTVVLGGETELQAKETTQHMYAALDIAVVQIEQQLHDMKASQGSGLRTRLRHNFRSAK